MKIFLIVLLIIIGLMICIIIYPVIKKKQNLLKNTNLTTIAKLIQKFEQMTILDRGDTYTEYVALIGKIQTKEFVTSTFSKKDVAYSEASANIITEKRIN